MALWQAYFPGCTLPPESGQSEADATAFRASLQMPEDGRRFDQWLHDLGRVLAAVEKWNSWSALSEVGQ